MVFHQSICTSVLIEHSLGIMSCLDSYMNIAMEQTEEFANGLKTNTYGDAFIRGNNGKSKCPFHVKLQELRGSQYYTSR